MSRAQVDLLTAELDLAFATEEWFSPLAVALEGVTAAQAAWQSDRPGNTIWQIVNHLSFWKERMLQHIRGIKPSKMETDNTGTFGEPGNPEEAEGWQRTVQRAYSLHEELKAEIASRADADLAAEVAGAPLARLVASLALHDAYHSGQVMLLRKQQGAWPATR